MCLCACARTCVRARASQPYVFTVPTGMYYMQRQTFLTPLYTPHYTESVLTAFRASNISRLERYKQYCLYGIEMIRQNTY